MWGNCFLSAYNHATISLRSRVVASSNLWSFYRNSSSVSISYRTISSFQHLLLANPLELSWAKSYGLRNSRAMWGYLECQVAAVARSIGWTELTLATCDNPLRILAKKYCWQCSIITCEMRNFYTSSSNFSPSFFPFCFMLASLE